MSVGQCLIETTLCSSMSRKLPYNRYITIDNCLTIHTSDKKRIRDWREKGTRNQPYNNTNIVGNHDTPTKHRLEYHALNSGFVVISQTSIQFEISQIRPMVTLHKQIRVACMYGWSTNFFKVRKSERFNKIMKPQLKIHCSYASFPGKLYAQ